MQHFATPVMSSRWNGNGGCAFFLRARSSVDQFAVNHEPEMKKKDDLPAQTVPPPSVVAPALQPAVSALLRHEPGSIALSSQAIASADGSEAEFNLSAPVGPPLPAVSSLPDGAVDATAVQYRWCVLRDGSISSLPPDPLPPLPAGVTDSSYAEWGGLFNSAEFFHCRDIGTRFAGATDLPKIDKPRRELIQSLRLNVDSLLHCPRTFACSWLP